MQKIIFRFLFVFTFFVCLADSAYAASQAVLNIVPRSTVANLNLEGIATITYVVTNQAKHPVNQLTLDPAYQTTGNAQGISLINDKCTQAALNPNQSCSFQILLSGSKQPKFFTLRPRICAYGGLVCSVPLASNEVKVTDTPITSFITNFAGNTVSNCDINQDGTLGTCTTLQDPTFNGPAGITLNSVATYAEVANFNDNSVSICPVNSNGILGACVRYQDPTFNGPVSIKSSYEMNFVYVTNFNNNTVSICPIVAPSVAGPCTAASQSFSGPNTVALNTLGTFAYITNTNNNTVSVCPIMANGLFGTCKASNPGATFHGPTGIAINPKLPFAYMSNSQNVGGNRNVSVCPINADGSLGTCTAFISTLFNFNNFGKVAVNAAGNLLYVVNQINNYITLCSIQANGQIGSCSRLEEPQGTFDSPQGITVGN